MKRLLAVLAAAVALSAIPLACDVQKTGNQIKAEKIMVATILGTPPIDVSPTALAGFDGGTFDAGAIPPDAGITFDGGSVTLPPQTAAFVFWGERDNDSLDTPPDPLDGAKITVAVEGGTSFELKPQDKGNYQLTSQDDDTFEYKSGVTYVFTADYQGQQYVGKVTDSPQLERVEALHPPKGYIEQTANSPFTFNRPEAPPGQTRNLGFVTVVPVAENGEQGDPTYTNIPTTPLEFLELVAVPSKWKQTQVTVPGTAFPLPGHTYVLVLQAVKLGGAESENLFKGSAILAGTAEVGVFRTK